MRRNLIVVRAGDRSLHRRWLNDSRARNFDLLVSYYGTTPGRHEGRADHYHTMTGPRWPAHDWLWRNRRDLFDRYERVGFVCDDVDARTADWNLMFDLVEWFALDLAQPSIVGYVNQPITAHVPGSILRYTDWIEVMCPIFSRRALALCADTFGETVSGWAIDYIWRARLPYPEYKTAIVDAVRVRHASKTREGELRPVLDKLGVDPIDETLALLRRTGVSADDPVELSRLQMD